MCKPHHTDENEPLTLTGFRSCGDLWSLAQPVEMRPNASANASVLMALLD